MSHFNFFDAAWPAQPSQHDQTHSASHTHSRWTRDHCEIQDVLVFMYQDIHLAIF